MEKKQGFWGQKHTSDNYGKQINTKWDHYSSTGKWGSEKEEFLNDSQTWGEKSLIY